MSEKGGIAHSFQDGYHVYQVDDGVDYWGIFTQFRDGALPGRQVGNVVKDRDVYFLDAPERRYVLKWDHGGWGFGGEGPVERFFWKFVRGPYYSRLLRRVNSAWQNNCHAMQRVFMVAEKRTAHYCHDAIILLEYVEGEELGLAPDKEALLPDVGRCASSLHANSLAVCDISVHNFLVTPDGIRAIDLVCRGNPRVDRIKDVIRLKRVLGIDLPLQGVVDRAIHWCLTVFQQHRRRRVEKKRQRRPLHRDQNFRGHS